MQALAKVIKFNFLSVIATFLLLGLSTTANTSQTITLVYNSEPNPPFNTGNHLLDKPGVTVEMLNKVANKLELKIHFVQMPWKRCLHAVNTNKVDGTIDASFKIERLKIGVYPMKNNMLDQTKRNNTLFSQYLSQISQTLMIYLRIKE
ncbi:transporter substrate-binding domain-containing protein [Zooshikella ganghwensis]|uniref:transporter substrate-binding domain-containing protein n=1 Tax=Zooshikella ganghwensis TaxID=202772 RepID=UPI0003F89058|nr:transporter substrate-binding domain-containing protein [Zooshikella ganghwensis]